MSKELSSNQHCYQIALEGCLDDRWADWFDGLTMTTWQHDGDITLLIGSVADQAALRGLLNQIWDFNLALISVKRLD